MGVLLGLLILEVPIAFAMMIGVLVGTYSSIFVASPIVYLWSKFRGSNLRRELLDANLEAQVNPARG